MSERGEISHPRQDTTPDAERERVELTRRAPLWKRAEQLNDLVASRRALMQADLRRRHPRANSDELHRRLAARLLPREDVIRLFGWDPEREGY
jgi:hypothetical protein